MSANSPDERSRMPSFKVYIEILDDPKMAKLSEVEKWRWVEIMALAKESAQPGLIVLSDELIAWRLRKTTSEVVESIAKFSSLGLVKRTEFGVLLPNFKTRQGDEAPAKRGYAEPAGDGWRVTVEGTYSRLFGKALAGKALADFGGLVERGVKPRRIVEAMEAVMSAIPRPRNPIGAALHLIEATPEGEPLRWQTAAEKEKPTVLAKGRVAWTP